MNESRFITNPDVVETNGNHCIVLIDPTISDIENIGLFCKVSTKEYDVYLYNDAMDDLEWLSYVASKADIIMQSDISKITLSDNLSILRFLEGHALNYFQDFDKS